MQEAMTQQDGLMPQSIVTSKVAAARLTVGLLQGLLLYALYRAAKFWTWPVTEEYLFGPLWLVGIIVPILLVSSLGHLDKKQLLTWVLTSLVLVGGLGLYDMWRGGNGNAYWFGQGPGLNPHYPSALLFVFSIAGFYIAHALVLAGAADKRRIARYGTYFEAAWKLLIQIKFSMLFVGVLWLVLELGAALFMLVKLSLLKELLEEAWFAIPVTAFAFSCAIHITDVRPAIVRGIRTLLLVLLSWILPITTLIVVGFLASLPWTGLAPLWATKHATSVLLGAAAVLVVLINAAFQNGETASNVARIVRISARIAAWVLLPIVAIAVYSLGLRVGDYGWTSDRIIAAACLVIASIYALGYARAACSRTGWLEQVASVNIVAAFMVLGVLAALFSPVADPARLSVNDQMARFASGRVAVDEFDFDYLKFEGARYGLAALNELKARSQGKDAALIREKAAAALKNENRWRHDPPKSGPINIAATIHPWPTGAHLPESFLHQDWSRYERAWELPRCLADAARECDAYQVDIDSDGKPEVLLVGIERNGGAVIMQENESGHWTAAATLPHDLAGCTTLRDKLRAGEFRTIAPQLRDLEIGGQRIEVQSAHSPRSPACRAGAR